MNPSIWPKTANASRPSSKSWACSSRRTVPPWTWIRRWKWPSASPIPWWCVPATCWAAAPWPWSMTRKSWWITSANRCPKSPSIPSSSTSSWNMPWKWTWTPCPTARKSMWPASWNTSKKPVSTPVTRPACCLPSRSPMTMWPSSPPRPKPWPASSRSWA